MKGFACWWRFSPLSHHCSLHLKCCLAQRYDAQPPLGYERKITAKWNYILHEFLADWSNLFAQSCAEHHNLLAVRSVSEDLLHVSSHVCKLTGKI